MNTSVTPKHKKFDLSEVEELKGLELTPDELQFLYEYVNNNFDEKAAWEAVIGVEKRRKLKKSTFYMQAKRMASRKNVKEAVTRLLTKHVESKKQIIPSTLIEGLIASATYDVSDIVDRDGEFIVDDLKELPVYVRKHVIEGIETKYWGKDADVKTTNVKLAKRSTARAQLIELMKIFDKLDTEEKVDGNVFNVILQSTPIKGVESAEELMKKSLEGSDVKIKPVKKEKGEEE